MPTPQEALDYAKRFIGNMPIDDSALAVRILDGASKRLWLRAPWRWSVGSLEAVQLVNGQQDYNLAGAYTDMLYLLHSRVIADQTHDLVISSTLPDTDLLVGRPSQVSFVSGSPHVLRFLPVPAALGTGPTVVTTYKKAPVALTPENLETSLETTTGLPDEWFWVYEEIVLLRALQFSNSPKAGSVTANNGAVQYAGQWGVVEAAIQEMLAHERRFFDSLGGPVNG